MRSDEVERDDPRIGHEHDAAAHGLIVGPRPLGSNDQFRTISATAGRRYDPGAMDLAYTAAEERFRAECRDWLATNVPRPPLPSGDTRAGFARHLEWERAAVRRGLRRGLVAPRVRRSRGQPLGVADLRGGVLRAGPRATRHPERHLPAGADDLRVRHPGAEGSHPGQDGRGRADLVPGLVRAECRQRPRRHPERGRARRRGRRLATHRPEDVDDTAVRSAPICSGCSAPTPPRNAIGVSPTSSSTSQHPA